MSGIMRENAWMALVVAAALGVIVFFVNKSRIGSTSFEIDEADYMYAVGSGFSANYFDKKAIPLGSFIVMGLSKGFKKEKFSELSRMIRSADDVTFYRHFHAPLYFYFMVVGEKWLGNNERAVRTFSLALQLLCAIAVAAGCLFLFGGGPWRLLSVLISLLILASPAVFWTVSLVSPHGMFVLWCLISLFIMAKAVEKAQKKYFYVSVGAVAVAFVSLEYAVLLAPCWLVCLVIAFRKNKGAFRPLGRFLFISALIWFAVIFILWPAAFLKLTLVKNLIHFGYFVIIRGAIVYAEQPLWNAWWFKIANSPVEYGIIAAGAAAAVFLMAVKKRDVLVPFAVYLFLAFLTLVRNTSPVPTYASSFVAVGLAAGGISLAMLLEKRKMMQITVLSLSFVLMFIHLHFNYLPKLRFPHSEIITGLNKFLNNERPQKVLVSRPELSMVHYYFPEIAADSYAAGISFKEQEISEIRQNLARTPDYDGMVYFGINGEEVRAVVAEQYKNEQIYFTLPGCVEQGIYFRFNAKREGPPQAPAR